MRRHCSSLCHLSSPRAACLILPYQLQSNSKHVHIKLYTPCLDRTCLLTVYRLHPVVENFLPQVLSSRDARLVVLVSEKSRSWLLDAPPIALAAGRLVLVAEAAKEAASKK